MAQIRFRKVDRPTLESMLAGLYDCIASGEASISHNGNTVSYSSPAQIRATIFSIENELDRRDRGASGAASKSPMAPQYPVISRGWN